MHLSSKRHLLAHCAIAVLTTSTLRSAQNTTCQPAWEQDFSVATGVDQTVRAMHVFDDGDGAALYVGGSITSAGGTPVRGVAKWDGKRWSALGGGINSHVLALASFDDGAGPALYAAGVFSDAGGSGVQNIAKWDGQGWSSLGSGLPGGVTALAVWDDGSGAALYAAGSFLSAGGVPANRIAKWDGQSWAPVGVGLSSFAQGMTVFDDGSGSALYVSSIDTLHKWNGQAWSALGSFDVSSTMSFASFDDGSGPALYAAGAFTNIGGVSANRVAKWNGQNWAPLGTGLNSVARAIAVFDDGAGGGPALYVSGEFTLAGGASANRIARWNGQSWAALGAGVTGNSIPAPLALATFDEGHGGGPSLFVGGNFSHAGAQDVNNLAKWRAAGWSKVGGTALNGAVRALASLDLPWSSGSELFVGGGFTEADGVALAYVARRQGSGWAPLGAGMNAPVHALAEYDDGAGAALYAGGTFTQAGGSGANFIAKWDGQAWTPLGSGLNSAVFALAVFDDGAGPALFVGGNFTHAGGQPAARVAKWNGQSWSALAAGLSGGTSFSPNPHVRALAVFDDGIGGPALYAGGHFTNSGGAPLSHLAKWDGQGWSSVGGGVALGGAIGPLNAVGALLADDGALGVGPALFVGGKFAEAGATQASGVARWNGQSWAALGSGVDWEVNALARFDDGGGSGPALFVGGGFSVAGGVPSYAIARWTTAGWFSIFSQPTISNVHALAVFEDDPSRAPALFVGVDGYSSSSSTWLFLHKWQGCSQPGSWLSYCTAGTSSNGCVPSIGATGSASASAASGFSIDVTQLEGQKQGLVLYGVNGRASVAWSAGSSSVLCVKTPVQRMGLAASGGTFGQCDGQFNVDWSAWSAAHPGALGQPFAAGEIVNAQAWYRDPPAPKGTQLSAALEFVLAP